MLTMYCDASGDDQSAAMRVGGFIASVDEWSAFDTEWKAALRKERIEYFHMREFAHSVEQFKDWKNDESRRQRFLDRLCTIIVTYARYSIGAGVLREVYRKVDADYQLHERFYPYTLCGLTCIDVAMQWRSNQTREAEPMGYVFECGDQHQGQLLKEGTDFAQTAPIFRTKTQATPLQAADFITYEQFKATTTILDLKVDQLFLRFRTSFQRLLRVPFHHGNVEETNLRVFCRRYDIPKRLS